MTIGMVDAADPAFLAYVVAFGAAAVAAFASVGRARRIDDPDTRRGLTTLLVASGAWAGTHVGFIAAPAEWIAVAFYEAGLIVGLAAVGPWLYFCSAYTGRTLHRNPTYRRVAVAVFLVIVGMKVTNPVHHLYFTTEFVTTPFPHTTVHNGVLHWLVMGLSYALSFVGFFMLFELFSGVSYRSRSLAVLVLVSGAPIVLDLAGHVRPEILDITYEPLGVAALAVGALFVYLERFRTVRVAGERDVPVIVLDEDDEIHEYNESARELFPEALVPDALGTPLDATVPAVADRLDSETPIISIEDGDDTRYYRVSTSPFTADRSRLGRLVILVDVTEREQYRRELERQNERLEQFANTVSHDLRNPLTVAKGQLEIVRAADDREELVEVSKALDRMEDLVEDLLVMARQGQPIDETVPSSLDAVADSAWSMVDAREATLDVEDDVRILAAPDRLQQLFENLFRNAVEHGGADVRVSVGALGDGTGFYVADDGAGIPEEERDHVLESGYTTNEDGTGFGLAIVADIADAHGWDVAVTESEAGGARFEIRGVEAA
ncbi:MAG: signal transduction histidine kinase [Halobacteriales archaeon]